MKYLRRTPAELRREHEHAELERAATKIIRDADRRARRQLSPPRAAPRAPEPVPPRQYRLSDLAALRRSGRVP